jgi:hypothetical protein
MKKILLASLAIAGIAASTGAQAQSTYTSGDALLFFRAIDGTGSNNSLLINLGSIGVAGNDSNGTRPFNSINIDLSAANSIVSQTYGTNWWGSTNIRWGVIGSVMDNGVNSNAYSYRLAGTTTPPNLIAESRIAIGNNIDNVTIAGFNTNNATVGLINGSYLYGKTVNGYAMTYVEEVIDAGGGNYTTNMVPTGRISYGVADDIAAYDLGGFGGVLATISKDISITSTMNLYTANNDINRGTGDFTLGEPRQFGTVSVANGVVSVVPEPATYALFGFGALLLILAFRRKNNA